jgi:hypothetical protein
MVYCPYCGRILEQPLLDGISTCSNCNRIFDSSDYNRILSAVWQARRTCEELEHCDYLTSDQIRLVNDIINSGYTHDELLKLFKKVA